MTIQDGAPRERRWENIICLKISSSPTGRMKAVAYLRSAESTAHAFDRTILAFHFPVLMKTPVIPRKDFEEVEEGREGNGRREPPPSGEVQGA
jgi:hypothetical protein